MAKSVEARDVKAWLSDGAEIALFDVREAKPYSEGHPFFAVPLHYSRLELDIEKLVPNTAVRMVLFDGGDDLAERAARRAARSARSSPPSNSTMRAALFGTSFSMSSSSRL